MTQIELNSTEVPTQPKSKSLLREVLETLALTAIIFFGVNLITGRFKIDGASMNDTFFHGEYIIVSRISYRIGAPVRGDIVVFVPPSSDTGTFFERLIGKPGETDFIKRVIGLPGDTVEVRDGIVIVNGITLQEPYVHQTMRTLSSQTWELDNDQYFVLGDNRNFSKDSRDPAVGPIPLSRIVGKVWLVYFPFPEFGLVKHFRLPEFAAAQ